MSEMNGHDPQKAAADEQLAKFSFGFQYAIDEIAKEIAKGGATVSSEAVIIALATKVGERLALVPERRTRRVILGKVDTIIRQTIARSAGE